MGFFAFLFSCCGPREKPSQDKASIAESERLLRGPPREGSVLSSDTARDYGALTLLDGPVPGGLTDEQRRRIDEIGREAGGYMLPISSKSHPSPHSSRHGHSSRTPLLPNQALPDPPETSSTTSSRPSSPSPMRPETSPPGGTLLPQVDGAADGDAEGNVVRKSLFGPAGLSVAPGRGDRKASRGRIRSRGRGK